MGLFGFSKNKKAKVEKLKDLKEMSLGEKKEFLSNDFIERMIRVEQKVSASFGRVVIYDKTDYYKSLTKPEKKDFEKYMKGKGMKKVLLMLPVLLILGFVGLINIKFTGNVVNESATASGLEAIWVPIVVVLIWVFAVVVIMKKIKKSRFDKHFDIIDEIGLRRYVTKSN